LLRRRNFGTGKARARRQILPGQAAGNKQVLERDDVPPDRPARCPRPRIVHPSDARTRAARPPGPTPTTSRSHTRADRCRPGRDAQSASRSWLLGLRSTADRDDDDRQVGDGAHPVGRPRSASVILPAPARPRSQPVARPASAAAGRRRQTGKDHFRPKPRPVRMGVPQQERRRVSSLRPSSCAISTVLHGGNEQHRRPCSPPRLRNSGAVSKPIRPGNATGQVAITSRPAAVPLDDPGPDMPAPDQVITHIPRKQQSPAATSGSAYCAAPKLRPRQDRAAPSLAVAEPCFPGGPSAEKDPGPSGPQGSLARCLMRFRPTS